MMDGVPRDWLPLVEEWPFEFSKKQWEFCASVKDHNEIIFLAGNGAGKSLIFYWSMAAFAIGVHPHQQEIGDPPIRIKILTTDFEHGLEKIARETLHAPTWIKNKNKEIGPIMPGSMIELEPKKDDKTLYLKNGSRIEWMTSEQKRKQHSGTNFDILGCDEEPEEPVYDESKRGLRTAKGGGRILWAFTPPYEAGKGPSWTKNKLFDAWEEGLLPQLKIIRAAMKDNPAVDEKFIEWFSQGKSEDQLRVQLYGEYPTWGKMIFPKFSDFLWNPQEVKGNIISGSEWEPPWYEGSGIFEFALDWHSSKPAAGLWTYEDREGDIYVFDELSPDATKDKTPRDVTRIILAMEGHPAQKPTVYRYLDPKAKDRTNVGKVGQSAWDEFRAAGIVFREGYNRQPEVGLSIINDFISGNRKDHPRLFVLDSCVNLRRAMKNHYWVIGNDGLGHPDQKWSDYPICLRYIVQRKGRRNRAGLTRSGRPKDRWPLTSYGGNPKYGPFMGVHSVRDLRPNTRSEKGR